MSLARNLSVVPNQSLAFKNRIINGAMVIDQRNAGASVTPASGNFVYTLDRWNFSYSQTSKFSVQQNAGSVTLPAGFSKYLGLTVASAVSIGATDYFELIQPVEGFNIADFSWGTANAKTVTLSFQVYSSLIGTFGGSIGNASGTRRSYPFTYSIPVANTWTTISITIPGCTDGTWTTDNTAGLYLRFSLGVGSTYSATAGAWASGAYDSATGSTSVVGTNGATFYITGVQLEVGSSASSFDYRPYGTELALCQRYYWRSTQSTGSSGLGWAFGTGGSTYSRVQVPVPVQMRPGLQTINYSNVSLFNSSTNANISTISGNYSSPNMLSFDGSCSATTGANVILLVYLNGANAYIDASSEL